jgi:hypothetical protein
LLLLLAARHDLGRQGREDATALTAESFIASGGHDARDDGFADLDLGAQQVDETKQRRAAQVGGPHLVGASARDGRQ